ncbi:TPA: long-chain fatty acid--CoA ligase [Corynebacterium striatum]|uniref:long-chain-fatty-acid--CoA ligase n=1 Tax=Corynebacterium striatum TaxID=43770 RepID=UPI001951BE7E|nr:long-chain-fatty-acid--CoA ligase [Corynebacterium striatum]QRP19075.1 long-chain fatty acid--CoA ligase [Corynebacterium striatum]HAT1137475.1 long-chain fatty acid--CoA ligase [Corynebacterium striatum]HAT1144990.1 long-chain fatty acid--CoA ligase [Corynebacterium striatum]HAT1168655.1 long-chain fatty acid--CoA ligase [Corynebacterium striatum]HAT1173680.1 long-chain fatty acid--CoA ligase [Corynebacterium striatum]
MSAFDTKEWLQFYPEWTPHNLDYGDTTLLDIYDNNLAINPDKPATYFFGKTQTFAEMDKQVRRAAAGLRAFGVRPGDKVAIVAPNCPQYVVAFYAILKLGAIAVLHNPLYTAHELEGLFKDHGARIAIAWDKTASTLEKLRGTTNLETVISINMIDAMPTAQKLALKYLPFLKSKRGQLSAHAKNTVTWDSLVGNAIGGDGRDVEPPADITKDTIAVIMYTSGTTGQPKGAQLSHGNFFAVILQGKHWVPGLGDKPERMLCALPFFHAYGLVMNVVLQPLIGGELVIIPKPDIALIMDLMKKHTPTWVPGVPTLYERIVESAEEQNIDIKGVRAAFSGASTLPVDTVEKWEQYTGGLLVEGYGLTECSPIIVGNPMSTDRRPGYVGIPFPDTEVRIANPDNLDETQPDGVEGEVLARGHQVFKGYLNNPEATEAAFHNGWFRTGDMGIMEEDGFIRLVSRIKEIIITGGFNVYPGEVEEVLRTHPAIDDVAVVGRPRSDGSEDVVACIDLADGAALDPEGLKEFCRERLTRYKVPRTFYHFEELAKDQMGKIRRREVQADLLERLEKEKAGK